MDISVVLLNLYTCFILFAFSNATQNAGTAESGPYKATLVKSERCNTPSKPYDKNPMSYFTSELYTSGKVPLLRGNLTVVRVEQKIWLSSKGFILVDGKYETIYIANAAGCNGVLMKIFKFGLNVQNNKGCVPKGVYLYKDVDFNAIQQTWTPIMKYGSYMWRLQVGTRSRTSICWEYYTVNTPL